MVSNSMKFQSIIMFIILGFIVIDNVDAYKKITPDENNERLESCGEQFLPQPSKDVSAMEFDYEKNGTGWLFHVKSDQDFPISAAFPISKRQFLTSSQVLLKGNMDWIGGNGKLELLDLSECKEGRSVPVPDKLLGYLEILHGSSVIGNPSKGTVLVRCVNHNFASEFHPLLLEITDKDISGLKIPCLADETSGFKEHDFVDTYGWEGGSMKHRLVKILNPNNDNKWIITSKYFGTQNRGGPLVWNNTGIATVIGLKGSSPPEGEGSGGDYFFDLRKFQHQLCTLVGVCGKSVPTTTEAPPTLALTPSPPPQPTPDPSESTSSNPTPSSVTSSKPPTFFTKDSSNKKIEKPKKTPRPKAKYPPMSRHHLYKEDVNNDFFVDADFINGAHFLNSLTLIFVLVLILG